MDKPAVWLVGLCCLLPRPATALPPVEAEAMLRAARQLLDVPYEFGGRMRKPGEGIDCQGVLFYAAQAIGRCGWRSFSVMPTQSVADRELGAPVAGLAPVAGADLDLALLAPGDILLFLGAAENPAEPALATLDGTPMWVWHTGIYSGEGRFIVGDHIAGRTVETDLVRYLADNGDTYLGLFVTRMERGPLPKKCRVHAPMPSFRAAP
jgi:hypothetical protein